MPSPTLHRPTHINNHHIREALRALLATYQLVLLSLVVSMVALQTKASPARMYREQLPLPEGRVLFLEGRVLKKWAELSILNLS